MASKSPRNIRAKAPAPQAAVGEAPSGTWPMQPPVDAEVAADTKTVADAETVAAESAPSPVIPGLQKLAAAEAEIIEHLEQAVEPAVAPAPATVKETVVDTMNSVADKAQTFFTDAQDKAKAAWDKSQSAFAGLGDFSKGNLEAVVESGQIAVRGMQSLGQEAADYTKKSFETGVAAMREMASVKSPTDLFKMQGEFFRSSFDALVAETSKNTETVLKLAGEVAQPISNRMAVAAEKAKVAA